MTLAYQQLGKAQAPGAEPKARMKSAMDWSLTDSGSDDQVPLFRCHT
jgi:hypothetical protein